MFQFLSLLVTVAIKVIRVLGDFAYGIIVTFFIFRYLISLAVSYMSLGYGRETRLHMTLVKDHSQQATNVVRVLVDPA